MHLPRVCREVLIEPASRIRSPLAPVFLLRSLPARSTIEILNIKDKDKVQPTVKQKIRI